MAMPSEVWLTMKCSVGGEERHWRLWCDPGRWENWPEAGAVALAVARGRA